MGRLSKLLPNVNIIQIEANQEKTGTSDKSVTSDKSGTSGTSNKKVKSKNKNKKNNSVNPNNSTQLQIEENNVNNNNNAPVKEGNWARIKKSSKSCFNSIKSYLYSVLCSMKSNILINFTLTKKV